MIAVDAPKLELARALAEVNSAFAALSQRQQDRVEIVADDRVEAALLDGAPAIEAIEDWKTRQLAAIEEAAR